ncbi:TOP3A [Cordylochernes scorpioides]|uniref:DNA topoisomerase n=1 Tax=Cordylochernes scorpioides TaxID=51811 RepID=A0ABY6KXT4_9ARAC|nr:TOP3A [Cordylochernes scorpioides]
MKILNVAEKNDAAKSISEIMSNGQKFSEITPQAIRRACANLVDPDSKINDAVNVRRELDLRIGAAFTRFQTLRLQKRFPDYLQNQLISYGSCQFPTLGFVVERYKQIENFKAELFWKLTVDHHIDKETQAQFTWKRGRLFDHGVCFVLYKRLLENPEARVSKVESKSKSKWRPLPLDTVEFEKLASRKLRMTAKNAMAIAEKLYTKGFISYPRTETNIFPKELDLNALVQHQVNDSRWGPFAQRVLGDGANPRQGKKTDNAHPPIHPTKAAPELQGDERKNAEGFQTTVNITVNEEEFVTKGLVILERNYLEVYPYDKWSDKSIPEYRLGETFIPTKILMVESETSPPPLLTEADLIALMEKHGIGTDATHAEHIETIKARLYIGLTPDSKFVPGQLGMGLVEGYDLMGFEMSKPHLRAELEADLKRICEGTKNPSIVLAEQVSKYKEVFIKASEQALKIDESLAKYFGNPQQVPASALTASGNSAVSQMPILKCPKCGRGDILVRTKKDNKGFYLGCMAYPDCTAALWLPESVEQVDVAEETCTECSNAPRKLKFKVKRSTLSPYYPDSFVSCLGGCDPMLLQVWNVPSLKNLGRASSSTAAASRMTSSASTPPNHNIQSTRLVNTVPRTQSTAARPTRPATRPNNNNNNRPSTSSEVACNCGKTCSLLTVRKEGPNKGRQFYKCSEAQGSQCNFFKWADEVPGAEDTRKKRKCGQCGQVGHNRKNCPQLR